MEVTRSKVVRLFERALDDATMAKRLEICLWNWTIQTCSHDGIPLYWDNPRYRYRYTTRAQSLEFNLKNPGNPALLERVRCKEVSVKEFAAMSPYEMWPDHWEPVFQRVAMKQMKREAFADLATAPDGAYTCGKCKSKKTVYTSVQIRSADEPMTNFVRCLNCSRGWKD